jgi:hypothetical protein
MLSWGECPRRLASVRIEPASVALEMYPSSAIRSK